MRGPFLPFPLADWFRFLPLRLPFPRPLPLRREAILFLRFLIWRPCSLSLTVCLALAFLAFCLRVRFLGWFVRA